MNRDVTPFSRAEFEVPINQETTLDQPGSTKETAAYSIGATLLAGYLFKRFIGSQHQKLKWFNLAAAAPIALMAADNFYNTAVSLQENREAKNYVPAVEPIKVGGWSSGRH
ncbi:MAG TPA: hypothetical protein VLF79_01065 [Candidatus Saccharimonadales bacterium]|nr:hypothetical protein [Candidatus Saccharimonadales bacterium]